MSPRVNRAARDEERAQGIAYVLIIGAVLLVFVTAIVSVLTKEMRWIVGAQRRSVLLTAADGAIDRAIAQLQVGGNWDNITKGLVTGYVNDVTYTDIPGIRYTIKVQEGNWTPGFQIGDAKLERTVTVFASNTITGDRKKIQVVVMQTTLSSALFSGGQITIQGNAKIHWGPVVSYSTASNAIPLSGAAPPNEPIYLSVGGITLNGVDAAGPPCNCDNDDPMAAKSVNEYNTGLLPAPVVPVDEFRAIAKSQSGRYFGGAGLCINPSPLTKAVSPPTDDTSVTFFDTSTGANFIYGTHTVDTKSCIYPAIGADIDTGGNFCGSGVLVVMGNLHMGGNGCSLGVDMIAPPDCTPKYDFAGTDCANYVNPSDLTWNGLIYIASQLEYSGNIKIYGTIDAAEQASTKGSMSIYYKTSSKTLGYLGKSILTKIWLERAPLPGEVFP